VKQDITTYIVS